MPDTFAALTAAGIVYDRRDFADPHLDGPTALTVTADGRVFGHLATNETCHIGYSDQCITPPLSSSGYKYFHQGVVRTKDGDLPVGKLTIGTGHASLGQNAVNAAAHYDNTGTVVASVRAGEDEHGIWLAGRLVPGTPPERVDELRRSGVSGDWRGIDGQMELVAALAVNVPGFPVPRTEQLTAAGGVTSLVAAGVVAPGHHPTTDAWSGEELEAMIASAADKLVGDRVTEAVAQIRRRDQIANRVEAIVASAGADRRARAVAEVERVQAARAADDVEALTAAVDSGVPGHLPAALKNYWTKGAGLARWSTSPHPYTALTRALRSELPAKAQHMVNGLAANLFKAVFGIYPGQRKELTAAAAGGRRVRTQEGADRYGVSVGDLIPAAMLQAQDMAGDFAEAAGNDIANLINPGRKKGVEVEGATADTPDADADVDEVDAEVEVDAPEPAAETEVDAPATEPEADVETVEPAAVEPATRTAGTGRLEEDQIPESGANGGALVDFADGVATYDDGSSTDGETWTYADTTDAAPDGVDTDVAPRQDVGAGTDHPMEEDEAPATGARGGKLVDFTDGVATYDDGSSTDGTTWTDTGDAATLTDEAVGLSDTDSEALAEGTIDTTGFTAEDGLDPNVDDFGEDIDAPVPGTEITDTTTPVRTDGTGYLEEDQIPETGANGGALVDYSGGVAFYDDGTDTDGTVWRVSEPVEEPEDEAVLAAAQAHVRMMRRLGYTVPNRRPKG